MRSLWGQMRSFICREVKQLAWGHVVRLYRSSNNDWHRVFPDLSLVITLCIQLLLCWYHYVLWQSFPGFLSVLVDFYFGAGLASLVWIPWFSLGKNHSCILDVCVFSRFRHVWFFMTLWTVVHQAPLSMGFSGQEYWSGLPCPPPGDRPHPGTEPSLLCLLHWQVDSLLPVRLVPIVKMCFAGGTSGKDVLCGIRRVGMKAAVSFWCLSQLGKGPGYGPSHVYCAGGWLAFVFVGQQPGSRQPCLPPDVPAVSSTLGPQESHVDWRWWETDEGSHPTA